MAKNLKILKIEALKIFQPYGSLPQDIRNNYSI